MRTLDRIYSKLGSCSDKTNTVINSSQFNVSLGDMINVKQSIVQIENWPGHENLLFAYTKTKAQISCAVTPQLFRNMFLLHR